MFKLVKSSFGTDHLEMKKNNIKPGKFKLRPILSRQTGKINDTTYFTLLKLVVESNEEYPFPVNLTIDFRGVFVFKDIDNDAEVLEFLKTEAVRIMFPYLRSITTNLTTTAMLPPIILPIVDPTKLFKEDDKAIYIN